jgi:hypothetical protein
MRTKKMQEGGSMPARGTAAARKAATDKAVRNNPADFSTFRDPEHGAKSEPLAGEVSRKQTGTTVMGDPYTAQQTVQTGTEMQQVGTGQYEYTYDADGNIIGFTELTEDVEVPTFGTEDAPSATISGSGAGPLQTGEEGMMLAKRGAKTPSYKGGGKMMRTFEQGGFGVMDPVDFVRMIKDSRKK